MTRLLGIDLGTRRIGLAVADTATGTVAPLTTVRRADGGRDADVLTTIVGEQAIDEIVLGLPLNMDGTEGEQALATRQWAEDVLGRLPLPCAWRDERLTSVRAGERLGRPARGRSGGPPSAAARNARRSAVDRLAAVLILQAELDARAGLLGEQ